MRSLTEDERQRHVRLGVDLRLELESPPTGKVWTYQYSASTARGPGRGAGRAGIIPSGRRVSLFRGGEDGKYRRGEHGDAYFDPQGGRSQFYRDDHRVVRLLYLRHGRGSLLP